MSREELLSLHRPIDEIIKGKYLNRLVCLNQDSFPRNEIFSKNKIFFEEIFGEHQILPVQQYKVVKTFAEQQKGYLPLPLTYDILRTMSLIEKFPQLRTTLVLDVGREVHVLAYFFKVYEAK